MNCETIQRRLLGTEQPSQPPTEVQAHLDGCVPCREWQGRLLQLEHNVPRLPVPVSAGRDAFLQKLLAEPAAKTPAAPRLEPMSAEQTPLPAPPPIVRLSLPTPPRRVPRVPIHAWRYAFGGMAAAAILLAVSIWVWRDSRAPAVARAKPDPLVASLVQRNLALMTAATATERAQALSYMANDLNRESAALSHAAGSEDLVKQLTALRGQVTASLQKLQSQPAAGAADSDAVTVRADSKRVRQLDRNRTLIQTLVEGGLRLASESDPLRRADYCSGVVQVLRNEIQQAARNHEGERAVEMAQHFRDMLQNGIAANLRTIRHDTASGSLREQEMQRVRDWVADVARPLEDELRASADHGGDMRRTLEVIRSARAEVEAAVRG